MVAPVATISTVVVRAAAEAVRAAVAAEVVVAAGAVAAAEVVAAAAVAVEVAAAAAEAGVPDALGWGMVPDLQASDDSEVITFDPKTPLSHRADQQRRWLSGELGEALHDPDFQGLGLREGSVIGLRACQHSLGRGA